MRAAKAAAITGVICCLLMTAAASRSGWQWRLPPGLPEPKVPADNPMSEVKVDLGRHLFYDTRLSVTGAHSCASCHRQALAFTDGLPQAVGATGERHPRGAMALANVAYATILTWGNPNIRRLEQQALMPMFGEHPVEMGLAGREAELLTRLGADPYYHRAFRDAFPEATGDPVTLLNLTRALAAFERTLLSGDAPYDRWRRDPARWPLDPAAVRGERLFFSEQTECFHCHGGFNLTGSVDYVGKAFTEREFFNNGLYNLDGHGAYPADNPGLFEFTGDSADLGKFKAPSLRNIALTAPYMHDGSIATLEEVVDHYAAGGRHIISGPRAGDGRANPNKSSFINGFPLTARQRADLVAFLRSLTDSTFVTDPRFADPWPAHRPGAP